MDEREEENGPSREDRTAGRPGRPPRAAVRERLFDAAREVFAERGVIGGTVEEICGRAGFTRGAFYSNFAAKEDLLLALIDREQRRLLAHLDGAFEAVVGSAGLAGPRAGPQAAPLADDHLRETMAAMADRLLRTIPDDRLFSLIQAELELHAIRDPETSPAFGEADARFRERIAEFLERGVHLLGRELVVDVGDVTEAVMAIVERSTRRAHLAGDPADPDALARVILPLLIAAATRPSS